MTIPRGMKIGIVIVMVGALIAAAATIVALGSMAFGGEIASQRGPVGKAAVVGVVVMFVGAVIFVPSALREIFAQAAEK